MKNKNTSKLLKIGVICLAVLSLTGCTTYLKDADNKSVQNQETGQNLPNNILCQPESEETRKIYEETREKLIEDLNKQLEENEITQSQ